MIARPRTFGDLAVNAYLRDANGTTWRIVAKDDRDLEPGVSPWYRCKNRAGEFMNISPKPLTTPVTVFELENDAERIGLLRDSLGATVLATKDHATGDVVCPAWPTEGARGFPLDVFREHLLLGHGVYATDIKTFAKLVECHTSAHDPETPTGKPPVMPHTHI